MRTAAKPRAFAPDMRVPIGRQPERCYITPSNPCPWYGYWPAGSRLSAAQVDALAGRRIAPEAAEVIMVRREATDREMWVPLRQLPPVYEFEAPLLGIRTDGRPRIIAPDGRVKLIHAIGNDEVTEYWANPPRQKPRAELRY